MKIFLLLSFLVLSSTQLFSQNHQLRGKIKADSIQHYQINIVNITQETGTTTAQDGSFVLPVKINDSIVFSSLIHEFKALRVNEKHLEETLQIHLKPQINELPEVVLKPYDLSGDFLIDVPKIKVSHIDQTSYGFGTVRRLTPIQQEMYFVQTTGLVGQVIMRFNGQMEQLKRRIEINNKVKKQLRLRPHITENLMRNQLKINPIYKDDFAYFCSDDPELMAIIGEDKLKMIEMLMEKSEAFKKSKYDLVPHEE
ncbi:MAG: hypothetical protein ACTHYV_05530 [Psychroflexus sp.]